MYSGTTLTPMSGRVFGAHQKIDKLARGTLRKLVRKDAVFPSKKLILHFEGVNGPDAIKRKSPAQDEPWHYYSPFDEGDTQLLEIISDHYDALVVALRARDDVRAAFEAAWIAHAIVDGLTPPHHFPYEEQLAQLRGGEGLETRNSLKGKLVMPGETPFKRLSNNWKMWGPHGLLTAHGFFEFGIATLIKPFTLKQVTLSDEEVIELSEYGVMELFRRKAKEIAALNMYESYQKDGWTRELVRQARRTMVPVMVHTVTLTWYAACIDAGLIAKPKAITRNTVKA
jgi:hypothetical protein